jgi:hypothetical protein
MHLGKDDVLEAGKNARLDRNDVENKRNMSQKMLFWKLKLKNALGS